MMMKSVTLDDCGFKAKKASRYGANEKYVLQIRHDLHCGSFRVVFRMHVGKGKGQ